MSTAKSVTHIFLSILCIIEHTTGFPTYQTVNSSIINLDKKVRNYERSHATEVKSQSTLIPTSIAKSVTHIFLSILYIIEHTTGFPTYQTVNSSIINFLEH